MILKNENCKLLFDIVNHDKLNLNNFNSINNKSVLNDKIYLKNLNNFMTILKVENKELPNSFCKANEIETFSNIPRMYSSKLNKNFNPIINHFNNELIIKKNEYLLLKKKYDKIVFYLDKKIESFENINSDEEVLIEPFFKKVKKAVKKTASKAASTVSNVANQAADAARAAAARAAEAARAAAAAAAAAAAEAARRAAELLQRMINEAIKKVKDQANAIKKQITDKLNHLNRIMDVIKKIRDEIVSIKNTIVNELKKAYDYAKNIDKIIPRLVQKMLNEKTKEAELNYKKAAEIKNKAILKAKKDLQDAIKLARRLEAERKKNVTIEKDEPLDNSDYELSANDANKDLNNLTKNASINLPEPKIDTSPFILFGIVCGIIFILHEFILPK